MIQRRGSKLDENLEFICGIFFISYHLSSAVMISCAYFFHIFRFIFILFRYGWAGINYCI